MVKLPGLQDAVNRASAPLRPSSPGAGASVRGLVAVALALLLAAASPVLAQEPQRVVRQLNFEDNRAISDEVLASAISTTNSSWFARFFLFRWLGLGEKRFFDEQEFKRDVLRLIVLYRRSGYPLVQIDTLARREPRDVYITFRIKEGPPIRLTKLDIIGVDSLPEKPRRETLVDLPLHEGDPFNRFAMQSTADTITRRLRDRGYPAARVFTSFESNKQTLTATVTFEVALGKLSVVGEVNVVGTQRIAPQVARSLLIARPARLYSQDELFQSQRNLYASDLFRFATVNIDSTKYQPTKDSVPIVVQVNEARRRRIRGGIGYATDDCFRGSLGWTRRNFLGSGGRILDLTGRISKVGVGKPFDWGLADGICNNSREDPVGSADVNFSLGASVKRPAFLSPNNTIAVTLFSERRSEFKVYLRQETGTTVTLSRETPRHRYPLSLAYTLSYGHTVATAESFCASFNACTPEVVALLRQNRVLATLTATGTLPKVNNTLDPSRGSLASGQVTWSSRLLGSSSFQQFVRTLADYSWYRPDRTRRSVQLARARGHDLRAHSGRRHPERQLRAARAAVLRRRPQRRARVRAQRARSGGLRRPAGRGRQRREPGASTQPRLGDRSGHRRQYARRRQRRAPGTQPHLQLAAPARHVRRCRRRLGARQRHQRRGHPGDTGYGAPAVHPAGPGPAGRRVQPLQAAGGAALPGGYAGRTHPRAGAGLVHAGSEPQVHLPRRGRTGVLMRRRIARFFFVFLLGTAAMVLGVVTSMTLTPPGRSLLARTVSTILDRIVIGQIKVGAISGSFLYDLTLQDLVVRDTAGALLADLPRVRVTYRLPNLIAGQVLLSGVQLDHPTIQLIKLRNGRMNFEEVLGLKKGPGGGTSPLIDFYKVKVTGGTLRIALPWNPDRSLRTAAQRDSALAAERAKPGRIIEDGSDGLRRVILLSDLNARFARLRITTPDRKPFTVDIDSLATRVNDPGVTIRDAVGRVRLHGDSAIFSLSRGALPDTRFSGGGALTWPHDTLLFDLQVTSPHVNLDDLHWVSPDFPAMTGSGVLAGKSETGARTAYDIRDLHLQNGEQRIDGALVAITDRRRGLGFRDMKVTLTALDLDAARAYIDSLPFYGTLSGTLGGAGFLDAMDVDIDWAFADARVPGEPISRIAGKGITGATKDSGLTFTNFEVRRSDIDLRTVRLLAPAVIIQGRLAAAGVLDGPLRNVTFRGTARQQDGDRPPSIATGTLHLDTRRDSLALATDIDLEPLSFEGIRRAFPTLKSKGDLRGRFVSEGTLSRLAVDADLAGDLGAVRAQGFVTLQPPKWGAEGLLLRFSRLNLAALTGKDLPTALAGELRATGSIDTLRAPEGELELALTRSRIREWTVDSLFGRGSVRDSVIRVDTAYAEWQGASASGGGTLGWHAPHDGRMRFVLAADSLIGFDSLLLAVTQQKRDTSADARPLNGRATGRVDLAGSLDSLQAGASFEVAGFEWQRIRAPHVAGALTWLGGQRPRITARASADTIHVQQWLLRGTAGSVTGFADSLDWGAGSDLGETTRLDAAGRWYSKDSARVVWVDTLMAKLAVRRYRLEQPVMVSLADSAPELSQLSLRALDGSSVLAAAGKVPGQGSRRPSSATARARPA